MLRIENLRAGYKGSDALHSVSIRVRRGTIVSVVGANGAGKSTLINTISRLVAANSGSILFEDRNITALKPADAVEDVYKRQDQCCFGFTEPDAGLNTTRIKTFAEKVPGGYLVNGQKVWTSTGQVANKIMLLTRTTRYEDCKRPTDGITIFYTDLDRDHIEVRRIAKMGRKAVDSNAIFIDRLFIPDEHRIGEEGKGFSYILDSLNPERILVGMEAIGIGTDALARAAKYAGERVVFDRPIGQNQGIQHPQGRPES